MDIVLVTALCNHTFRLPQVILDVGVEVNGFGPAIAEDGLTDEVTETGTIDTCMKAEGRWLREDGRVFFCYRYK
jgi:hypothetical protein